MKAIPLGSLGNHIHGCQRPRLVYKIFELVEHLHKSPDYSLRHKPKNIL